MQLLLVATRSGGSPPIIRTTTAPGWTENDGCIFQSDGDSHNEDVPYRRTNRIEIAPIWSPM